MTDDAQPIINRTSLIGQKTIDPPMSDLERALEELFTFEKNHNFIHGDIKRTAFKYHVNYDTLQKRWDRLHHKSDKNYDQTKRRNSGHPQPVDIHGSTWWNGFVPDLSLVYKLPFKGRNRHGFYGFSAPEVSIQVRPLRTGGASVRVFDHKTDSWHIVLVLKLREYGWSDEAVGGLFDSLRFYGKTLHIGERCPGVQHGLIWQSKDGNEKVVGDSTPYPDTKEALIDSVEKLLKKIDAMPDMIPEVLHKYLGGKTPMLILAQMESEMMKMKREICDLKFPPIGAPGEARHPSPPNALSVSPSSVTKPQGAPGSGEPFSDHQTPNEKASPRIPQAQIQMAEDMGISAPRQATLGIQIPPKRPEVCPLFQDFKGAWYCKKGGYLKASDGKVTEAGNLCLPLCGGNYEECEWYK